MSLIIHEHPSAVLASALELPAPVSLSDRVARHPRQPHAMDDAAGASGASGEAPDAASGKASDAASPQDPPPQAVAEADDGWNGAELEPPLPPEHIDVVMSREQLQPRDEDRGPTPDKPRERVPLLSAPVAVPLPAKDTVQRPELSPAVPRMAAAASSQLLPGGDAGASAPVRTEPGIGTGAAPGAVPQPASSTAAGPSHAVAGGAGPGSVLPVPVAAGEPAITRTTATPAAAPTTPAPLQQHAPRKATGTSGNPAASAPATPASSPVASAAPSSTADQPTAPDTTPPANVASSPSTPSPPPADAGDDGQTRAELRREEANLGTRHHARTVRQANLQIANAPRADAASHLNVAFSSWGPGHRVRAVLEGGRLHMQASSARVGQALSSASAPQGTELQIAVDSSDHATDERRRRGRQGHA